MAFYSSSRWIADSHVSAAPSIRGSSARLCGRYPRNQRAGRGIDDLFFVQIDELIKEWEPQPLGSIAGVVPTSFTPPVVAPGPPGSAPFRHRPTAPWADVLVRLCQRTCLYICPYACRCTCFMRRAHVSTHVYAHVSTHVSTNASPHVSPHVSTHISTHVPTHVPTQVSAVMLHAEWPTALANDPGIDHFRKKGT